jgi:hypothetical protein
MAFCSGNKRKSDQSYTEIVRLTDKILLIYFACGGKQHQAIGRFQAHYDAPVDKFRAGYFTRGEFVAWTTKFPLWQSPWVGTNNPIKFVDAVASFPDVGKEEQFVIDEVKKQNMPEDSYLITSSSFNGALQHELIHALFHVDHEYRKAVLDVIAAHPKEAESEYVGLRAMGYADISLADECNAYICGGATYSGNQDSMQDKLKALAEEEIDQTGIDIDDLMLLGSDNREFSLNSYDEPFLKEK